MPVWGKQLGALTLARGAAVGRCHLSDTGVTDVSDGQQAGDNNDEC